MKKVILLLFISIFLVSCSNDDDDNCDCKRATTYSGWVNASLTP